MNVFFKIYLNQHSGLGHLSRCLIIAEKLPINYKIFFLTDSIFDLKKLIKLIVVLIQEKISGLK